MASWLRGRTWDPIPPKTQTPKLSWFVAADREEIHASSCKRFVPRAGRRLVVSDKEAQKGSKIWIQLPNKQKLPCMPRCLSAGLTGGSRAACGVRSPGYYVGAH